MQQLDLFGMPVEPVATPAKKSKPAPQAVEAIPVQEIPKPVEVPVQENPVELPEEAPVTFMSQPTENAVIAPSPESISAPIEEIIELSASDADIAETIEHPTVLSESVPAPVADASNTTTEPVVFADARIVVKIKQRNPNPAPETASIPEPSIPARTTLKKPTIITVEQEADALAKQPGKRGRKSFKEIDNEVDLIEVPDEETLQQKLYYSISEVAGWFKVNTSLLRYWENEFDVLKPRKTRKGDRLFRVEDIRNLQLIYFLLRQRKLSIEGARNYLKQNRQQADVQVQLVQSLTRFKSFLLELKAGL